MSDSSKKPIFSAIYNFLEAFSPKAAHDLKNETGILPPSKDEPALDEMYKDWLESPSGRKRKRTSNIDQNSAPSKKTKTQNGLKRAKNDSSEDKSKKKISPSPNKIAKAESSSDSDSSAVSNLTKVKVKKNVKKGALTPVKTSAACIKKSISSDSDSEDKKKPVVKKSVVVKPTVPAAKVAKKQESSDSDSSSSEDEKKPAAKPKVVAASKTTLTSYMGKHGLLKVPICEETKEALTSQPTIEDCPENVKPDEINQDQRSGAVSQDLPGENDIEQISVQEKADSQAPNVNSRVLSTLSNLNGTKLKNTNTSQLFEIHTELLEIQTALITLMVDVCEEIKSRI